MDEIQTIQNKIYEIRGQRVMLDFDLAAMYGGETRALNQSVKRNIERFPEDFMFQLTKGEFEILTNQVMKSQETDSDTSDFSGDSIIKPLRKCSGKPFCTIDEDNLRDFTKDEFAKYKDLYWRSFSIINKVIGVGDKMVKAAYLDELHEVIEETDVFSYLNDDEMTRLNLLSSVIKQKWV